MAKINKSNLVIFIFIALIIGLQLYNYLKSSNKTGYIVLNEVFDAFEMKKELEQHYLSTTNKRKSILDSLELEINLLNNKINSNKYINSSDTVSYRLKINEYIIKKRTFDEDNNSLSVKYDEQIITQLNQYVKDYGKEHNYSYIFGADGNGILMYADEAEDITKEVTEYINLKYNGKN